jgi:hypothetical protein
MLVIALMGTRCPMEENPRKYITDSEAVEVPETTYYRRLIIDGSLQETKKKIKEVKTDGK